ncbi:STAS domain-containing protein [Kordia sp.]|uniref:STAS domain-containing protein n=1 Tax=Kordia sp. TaxID=1965332 RepID=UPI003D27A7DE
MALQITQQNGTFLVDGQLNSATTTSFMNHFKYIIEQQQNVVLNIDGVTEIDYDGLAGIKTLTAIALRNHKMFSVIGNGCKDIYQDFNCSQVA